jgi:hypothetical protein
LLPCDPLRSFPDAWLLFAIEPTQTVYFEGDNRSFNPYTANTFNFRTAQQIEIDFTSRSIAAYANTGFTTRKIVYPNGQTEYTTAHASTSGITCTNISWGSGQVSFHLAVDSSNPLVLGAPAINYDFDVTVYSDGTVKVTGAHDGFPAYEMYKCINNGSSWYTIYQYNPYDNGKDVSALAPPEDVSVSRTV